MKHLILLLLIVMCSCEMPSQKLVFIGDSHMVATLEYLNTANAKTFAKNGLSFRRVADSKLPEGDVAVVWLGTNDIYLGFDEYALRRYIVRLRRNYRRMVFIEVPHHIPNADAANAVFAGYGTVIALPRDSHPSEDNIHFNMSYYKARANFLQRNFLSNP